MLLADKGNNCIKRGHITYCDWYREFRLEREREERERETMVYITMNEAL